MIFRFVTLFEQISIPLPFFSVSDRLSGFRGYDDTQWSEITNFWPLCVIITLKSRECRYSKTN